MEEAIICLLISWENETSLGGNARGLSLIMEIFFFFYQGFFQCILQAFWLSLSLFESLLCAHCVLDSGPGELRALFLTCMATPYGGHFPPISRMSSLRVGMLSDLFKATQPEGSEGGTGVCSAFCGWHNPAAHSENTKERGSLWLPSCAAGRLPWSPATSVSSLLFQNARSSSFMSHCRGWDPEICSRGL